MSGDTYALIPPSHVKGLRESPSLDAVPCSRGARTSSSSRERKNGLSYLRTKIAGRSLPHNEHSRVSMLLQEHTDPMRPANLWGYRVGPATLAIREVGSSSGSIPACISISGLESLRQSRSQCYLPSNAPALLAAAKRVTLVGRGRGATLRRSLSSLFCKRTMEANAQSCPTDSGCCVTCNDPTSSRTRSSKQAPFQALAEAFTSPTPQARSLTHSTR